MKHKIYSFLLTATFGLFGMNAWAQDYEISSAQDLVDFADAVNSGETGANAVLTADIDMSELTSWTAIGDWNTGAVTSAYCGHFDGQGHTIKNFNFTSTHNSRILPSTAICSLHIRPAVWLVTQGTHPLPSATSKATLTLPAPEQPAHRVQAVLWALLSTARPMS